ncbi:unnamed protein product [Bursaphelenchus xylophilus]|uniref:(pine wood nematode) hypothetical protein n=1 Tax=Bursaphelenchus xylophilus TaxID=6326 RepID=A0A1I7RJV8_BURXY|nr:unnamed protein product [Bursaphelenchus xylophilus]CAG9129098.1 unnamed protein product [Bursaphelenchus xylophilus]
MSQAARKCRCWPQMSAARKVAARKKFARKLVARKVVARKCAPAEEMHALYYDSDTTDYSRLKRTEEGIFGCSCACYEKMPEKPSESPGQSTVSISEPKNAEKQQVISGGAGKSTMDPLSLLEERNAQADVFIACTQWV